MILKQGKTPISSGNQGRAPPVSTAELQGLPGGLQMEANERKGLGGYLEPSFLRRTGF